MGIINKGYRPLDLAAMSAASHKANALYAEARELTIQANEAYMESSVLPGPGSVAAFRRYKDLKAQAAEMYREADALAAGRIYKKRENGGAIARRSRECTDADFDDPMPKTNRRGAYRMRPAGSPKRTPEEEREYNRARMAAWRAKRRASAAASDPNPLDGLV